MSKIEEVKKILHSWLGDPNLDKTAEKICQLFEPKPAIRRCPDCGTEVKVLDTNCPECGCRHLEAKIKPKPDERFLTEEEMGIAVSGIPACGKNLSLNLLQHKHATERIAKAQLAKDRIFEQARVEGIKKEIEEQSIVKRQIDTADKKLKPHRQMIVTEDWWQKLWKQKGVK